MSWPTIYLDSWRVLQHPTPERPRPGPGRAFAAMALPREHESREGVVPACAPDPEKLRAVRSGRLSVRDYLLAFDERLARREEGGLEPGALLWSRGHRDPARLLGGEVHSQDILCCACPPRREPTAMERLMGAQVDVGRMPCHLEVLAPRMAASGWRTVLYGAELVSDGAGWTWRGAPYSWDPADLHPPGRRG